jgi:two-component system sensor histidine kinase KdpD
MVLANLVANAVKYSPDQRHIEVSARREGGTVVVAVADRGVGIPPDERRAVFAKYRRASNAADVATGTGLGLALVDAIVRAHGGAVEVQPREGGGSLFRVSLPLSRSV